MSGQLHYYTGIDFGTTNSAMVSMTVSGQGRNFTNCTDEMGGPFPSLLAIDKETGKLYTGRRAWQDRRKLSSQYEIINSIKSYLGTEKLWHIAGETWTPEKIAAQILVGLKKNAEERHKIPLERATFSIPVGYSSEKRMALRTAAQLAGIEVVGFISESTTAVLRSYESLKKYRHVAVFDWGGGTLDVSIIELNKDGIHEIAVKGLEIGGDEIDLMLARFIHTKIARKKGSSLSFEDMSPEWQDRLLVKAEAAKKALGDDDSTSITIPRYGELGAVIEQIDIDAFSLLIEPLINEAIMTLESAVKESGLSMNQIECILMIGGSSYLRPLQEKIEIRWLTQQIEFPDESEWFVAGGAAVLNQQPGTYVLNQDIGVLLSDGNLYPVKNKNSPIPSISEVHEFGIIEESENARFIFAVNSDDKTESDKKIIGYVTIPTYGFVDEKIILTTEVNEDMVFVATIKSSHHPIQHEIKYEYSTLKFYYKMIEVKKEVKHGKKQYYD